MSGMRVIGAADEFWRLRLVRVDATGAPDFEWRDDVLYRTPSAELPEDVEEWSVEAIRIEDYETVISVASFAARAEAEAFMERATSDLSEMTKSQFEDAYLSPEPFRDEAADS